MSISSKNVVNCHENVTMQKVDLKGFLLTMQNVLFILFFSFFSFFFFDAVQQERQKITFW